MIPADWYAGPLAFPWQVVLHSSIAGFVLYAWAHRVGLPSGRTKRLLLSILLVLPLFTAAIPGRGSLEFRDRLAWLDSGRLLALPLVGGFRLADAVLGAVLLTTVVTVWQEIVPVLRRARTPPTEVPVAVADQVRARQGWERCEIAVEPSTAIGLATGGWPWRPRLLISRGALQRLSAGELVAALDHEHAHWQARRWLRSHALFAIRMLQPHNPVALWAFREYCLELEIECDAAAVAGRDPRVLTRTLLRIYESTPRRDVAARSILRKRVDLLLEASPAHDPLPLATTVVATAILAVVLPWFV